MQPVASLSAVLRVVIVYVAFALVLTSASARAEDARARARALFNEGVARYEAGQWQEALSSFEQAYRLSPHPAVRVNMANCFEQLHQYVEALFNYERFIEESDEPDSAQHAEVLIAIARLSTKVGTLTVSLEPSDAQLTVDGKEPKRSPTGALQLTAGVHTLRATAEGYEPDERSIAVQGASEDSVSVTLKPKRSVSALPVASAPIVVETSTEASRSDAPESEPNERKPLLWAGVGTTAVLAASFAITGGLAIKARRDFDDAEARSNDPSLSAVEREQARNEGIAAADQANVRALLADVFLASAVVAGGATLVIWLTGRKKTSAQASLHVAPALVAGGGAGVSTAGAF